MEKHKRESEFDNETFFEEYAKMARSVDGLEAAGEWHQLRPLFPALEGKTVLDLGCGYGWHCRYAAEQGAKAVLGIDLSEKMLESAAWRTRSAAVTYRLCGIEDYEYPENTWDCVISNLALHYIADLDTIFRKIYKTLKPGGTLLLISSIRHLRQVSIRIGFTAKTEKYFTGRSISISCRASGSQISSAAS